VNIDDLRDFDDDASGGDEFDFEDELPANLQEAIGDDFDEFADTGGDDESFGELLGQAWNEVVSSMSPGERAFISAMIFFNVLVLGLGLLLATGRIG